MKKIIAFMMMTLLTAGMCLAGTVKVLKTEYAGVDIDEDGPYVTINVQLQVSNVKQEECSCIALLNNSKWNGENMTIAKLANLSQTMCEGDTDLDPVTGTKTITVPVYVPLDASLLTGTEKTFFLKSYVVDMNKKAIIAQGTMINFVPNPKESMAKKQQDINSQVMKMATKNLGPKKGGQTKGETKKVTVSCPECSGSGKTYRYDLNRYVSCDRCDGDGKITKDQKGANAILGVHIDFDEISGKGKSMFMITAYGTAVIITPEIEKLKKIERYDVYQKLYNLAKFKEAGVITDEQYEAEKSNIILSHEACIAKEIEAIKTENEHKEAVKQAQILSQQLAEQREKELQEELQRQAEERRQNMTAKEREAELRKEKEPEIEEAYKEFLSKAPTTIIQVRNLLSSNVISPQEPLRRLTVNDIMGASYESMEVNTSNNAAFNIGLFLKHRQVAEACKYYIDLVGDEDIEEAKSYVFSIYEMMVFKDQKAFERMAKNLIELKCLGKTDEAILEFSKYAVCDKEIARQVIELL